MGHDPAAALVDERGVVAAIEESKLVRSRDVVGIPHAAIRYCLERSGTRWSEVECVAVASKPVRTWAHRALSRMHRMPSTPFPENFFQEQALGDLTRELNTSRLLHKLDESLAARVVHLDHQLCHAASAFFASPLDRALVLSLDEGGDGHSGLVALGEGTRLRALRGIQFPNSLGWLFTQVTRLLGFAAHRDEHKTQWLGMGTEPAFEKLFLDILRRKRGSLPSLDMRYFNRGLAGRIAFSPLFYRAVGLDPKRFVGPATRSSPEPVPEPFAASLPPASSRPAPRWLWRSPKPTARKPRLRRYASPAEYSSIP